MKVLAGYGMAQGRQIQDTSLKPGARSRASPAGQPEQRCPQE
jgi:hypothetical protein